ncbi:MAG: hypothetical protein ABMB14_33595 [Myxococcota bacterium]
MAVPVASPRSVPTVDVPQSAPLSPSRARSPKPVELLGRPSDPKRRPDAQPSGTRLPPLSPWLGVDTAARPGVAIGGGVSLGAEVPVDRWSVGVTTSVHPARSIPIAADATVTELAADVAAAFDPTDWLRVGTGFGLAVRDFAQHADRVSRVPTPRWSTTAELGWPVGPLAIRTGVAFDLDLAATRFVDDAGHDVLLAPFTVRPTIRVQIRTSSGGAHIGVAETRDE